MRRRQIGRDNEHIVKALYARQQHDPNATLDFLLLSGGGDHGAFGTGFLLGWANVPPGASALPKFDGVSGVSTGALIAPFAFLGTRADYETIDRLFRNPKPDWWKRRGLLFFLPDNASLAAVPGLERDLRAQVTLPFAKRIVEAAHAGSRAAHPSHRSRQRHCRRFRSDRSRARSGRRRRSQHRHQHSPFLGRDPGRVPACRDRRQALCRWRHRQQFLLRRPDAGGGHIRRDVAAHAP